MNVMRNQRVANAQDHPKCFKESNLTHAEMLRITAESEESRNKINTYRKRQMYGHDAEIINRHLTDLRESHMDGVNKPVHARDLSLKEGPERYHETIYQMLEKHAGMLLGKLGSINVTEHSIDLIPSA